MKVKRHFYNMIATQKENQNKPKQQTMFNKLYYTCMSIEFTKQYIVLNYGNFIFLYH